MNRIILIDNYDSFTFNLVELFRQLDTSPYIITTDDVSPNIIEMFEKLVISPGFGTPNDFPKLYRLIHLFYKRKSILGICLGHQAIASYFGSTLERLNPVCHGQRKRIHITKQEKLFKNVPSSFWVGLYHSWHVSKSGLPRALEITAISEDGIIMGISHKKYNVFGIQFHPESYMTEYGKEIIKNFLKL